MKTQIAKLAVVAKDDPTVTNTKVLQVATDPDSGKMAFIVNETVTTSFMDFGEAKEFYDALGQS